MAKHRDDTATTDLYRIESTGRYGMAYEWFVGDLTIHVPVAEWTADATPRHASA